MSSRDTALKVKVSNIISGQENKRRRKRPFKRPSAVNPLLPEPHTQTGPWLVLELIILVMLELYSGTGDKIRVKEIDHSVTCITCQVVTLSSRLPEILPMLSVSG